MLPYTVLTLSWKGHFRLCVRHFDPTGNVGGEKLGVVVPLRSQDDELERPSDELEVADWRRDPGLVPEEYVSLHDGRARGGPSVGGEHYGR